MLPKAPAVKDFFSIVVLRNWSISGLFSVLSSLQKRFIQIDRLQIKFAKWPDLNRESLVSEATVDQLRHNQ